MGSEVVAAEVLSLELKLELELELAPVMLKTDLYVLDDGLEFFLGKMLGVAAGLFWFDPICRFFANFAATFFALSSAFIAIYSTPFLVLPSYFAHVSTFVSLLFFFLLLFL